MKKLIVLVLLLAAVSATAQTVRHFGATESDNVWTGKQTFQKPVFSGYTVATLPASPSAYQVGIVTDGATAGDCVAGGGSFIVLCSYYSGAWNAIGGGGSGNATQLGGVDLLTCSPTDGEGYFFNSGTGKFECSLPSTATVPDADATTKGKIQLAGDLGGTAASPTTPTAMHLTGNESASGTKTFSTGISTAALAGAYVIDAAKITTGTIPPARILTNTASRCLRTDGSGNIVVATSDCNVVTSVFGRTGVVTATSGDYGVAQITGAAPLASPTFTGTVTMPAPTFNTLTGSTQCLHVNSSGVVSGVAGECLTGTSAVSSFNSRTGAIVPTAGDYNFAKISNNIAWSQFPQGCSTNQIPKFNGSSWACDNDLVGAAGTGVTTINGLTADPQVFAFDTSDANLRLTVSSVSSTHTFYPAWTGTLGKARGGTGADTSSVTYPSSGTIAISTDITKTAVGLANVTNDVQTKAAVMPNTAPTDGQLPIGLTASSAYVPHAMSQDCTMTNAGVVTCTKTNNVAFGTAATKNTGTTGSDVAVGNAATTVNGQSCALGGSCTIAASETLNSVGDPTADKSFGMTTKTLNENWTGNYGSAWAHSISSGAGAAGATGYLFDVSAGHADNKPFQFCASGSKCFQMDGAGALTVSGGATIPVVGLSDIASAAKLGGTDKKLAVFDGTAPASNKCVEVNSSGNLVVGTANDVCGAGGGGWTPPTSALGQMLYATDPSGVLAVLPAQTAASAKMLTETGTGTGGAIPAWSAAPATSGAVANRVLSSYSATTGAFGVTDLAAVAGSGLYSALLSPPQLAVTKTAAANQFLTSFDSTTGLFAQSLADYTGLTNKPSFAITPAANNFVSNYSTSTGFTVARPTCANLSDASGGCTMSTTAGTDLTGTLPNATVAKVNGTSVTSVPAADTLLRTTALSTASWAAVPNCAAGSTLNYSTTTHLFTCNAVTANAAGTGTEVQYRNSGTGALAAITGTSFDGTTLTLPAIATSQITGTGTDSFINFPSNTTHVSVAGDFTRNAANLLFHDGTANRTLLNDNSTIAAVKVSGNIAGGAASITGNLTGDVTSTGMATTLANIPTAIPAAGSIVHANITAPASPAVGKVSTYSDSTDLRFHDKNASGVIGTTVVADTGTANNFLTAISAAGAISKARPTCSSLSDAGTACTAASTAFLASSTVLAATKTAVAGSPLLSYDSTTGAFTQGALTATNVGLGSVTNDAQTKAAVVPNTLTAHALYAGNTTSAISAIGPDASTTKALFSAGVSADPAFRAIAAADLPAALANSTSINGTSVAASKTLVYTDTAILAAQMPALTGDVTTSAGAVATTLRTGLNVRTCEMHIWGTGASSVLQDTDDEIASCLNKWGVTFTVTYVGCWANAGSPTLMVTKTGGNNVLSGNLTCGTATFASGSLTVTTADKQTADGGTLDLSIVAAGGTATNIRVVIVGTI